MYQYKATLIKVIDGDTVDLNVDLGCDTFIKMRCRLFGINTPERGQPGYGEATEALRQMLTGVPLIVNTIKDRKEKYGRYLVHIWTTPGLGDSVNSRMILANHAVKYLPYRLN